MTIKKTNSKVKNNFFTSVDMVFEDDSKLLGLLMRYSDPSEIDDLKTEIVKYINT